MHQRPKIDVTSLERWALYVRGNFTCVYCQCRVIPGAHTSNPRAATLDHMDCFIHGGSDLPNNLIVACASCNSARCDTRLSEWLWHLGWLMRQQASPSVWDCSVEDVKIRTHARTVRRTIRNQARRKLNLELSAKLRNIYTTAITHSLEGCVI